VSGRRLLAALGIWLLLGGSVLLVSAIALRALAPGFAPRHAPDLVAGLMWLFYLSLLAALYLSFGGWRGLSGALGFHWTGLQDVALAEVVWIMALISGALLTSLGERYLGPPQSNALPLVRISLDPVFVALLVPLVALVGPAAEEMLFRGALLGWLRSVVPLPLAVVLSAAVFAGAHLIVPLLPLLFVFGLAAAYIYQRTGSTLNSFVMHATQNSLALIAAYLVLFRH